MVAAFSSILYLVTSFRTANAFLAPRAFVFVVPCNHYTATTTTSRNALSPHFPFSEFATISSSSLTLGTEVAEEFTQADFDTASAGLFIDQAGEGLRNMSIGIIGVVAVIAAIATFFAGFLIPQAAAQLEQQVKDYSPDLWNEYQAKLELGETLAMRPDLMQELGTKMQQANLADFDANNNDNNDVLSNTYDPNDESVVNVENMEPKDPKNVIIDAEVTVEQDDRA